MSYDTSEMSAAEYEGIQSMRHVAFASCALIVYDILITLGTEINLVWRARLSFAKALFLLNRYGTLFTCLFLFSPNSWGLQLNETVCLDLAFTCNVLTDVLSFGVGSGLLLLRIRALYKGNRVVLAIVGILLLTQLIVNIFVSVNIRSMNMNLAVNPLGVCAQSNWSYAWTGWIPMVIFDSTVFVLTCWKTWEYARQNMRTPLLICIMRDGILYFAVMLGLQIVSMACLAVMSGPSGLFGVYFTYSLPSIMVSRIYLHLKGVITPQQWTDATIVCGAFTRQQAITSTHSDSRRSGPQDAYDSWLSDDDEQYE